MHELRHRWKPGNLDRFSRRTHRDAGFVGTLQRKREQAADGRTRVVAFDRAWPDRQLSNGMCDPIAILIQA